MSYFRIETLKVAYMFSNVRKIKLAISVLFGSVAFESSKKPASNNTF